MVRVGDAPSVAPDRLDRLPDDALIRRLLPELATDVEWGLARTERALAALDDPHRSFRSIHVGGTNGKGSVTATVAAVLSTGGRRTGSYTSPHLCSFRERMLVGGRPIDEAALIRYGDEARDAIERFGLTFFEAVTVLALHAFRGEGVEIAAVEVGLGGRLDATNVIVPDVAAVTNIALDHAEYLGRTLPEIAREKAGIMKPGVPFLTAEQAPELLAVFDAVAEARGTRVERVNPADAFDVEVTSRGTSFRYRTEAWGDLAVTTPLVGAHQVANTVLAIEVLARLEQSLRPDREDLLAGIRGVRHPGRDELHRIGGRTWLLDVAHNGAGMLSLVDTLDRLDLPEPVVALVGVLGDKDWRTMLPPLRARTRALVLTVPPTAPLDRRWDPTEVATALAAGGAAGSTIVVEPDFAAAVRRATDLSPGGTVVVTGSVHTVGAAMRALLIDPLG